MRWTAPGWNSTAPMAAEGDIEQVNWPPRSFGVDYVSLEAAEAQAPS
jgi:hypothetical protein